MSCDRSSGSSHTQPAKREIVSAKIIFGCVHTFSPSYSSVNSAFSCSGKSLHICPMMRPISQSFSSGFSFFTLKENESRDFPGSHTNLIPNSSAVSHVGHQGLLWCFWRFWNPMSRKSFGSHSLRVEGVVSVLLRREGVGLHLVLLLLSHQITL